MRLSKLLRHIASETDAVVNLQVTHPSLLRNAKLKLDPDQYLHSGAFCREMKLNGKFSICSANKKKSLIMAKRGEIFAGTCPNGIWELACPVIYDNTLVAVIYFGHFSSEYCKIQNDESIAFSKVPLISKAKKKELAKWAEFTADFIRIELKLLELEHPHIFKKKTGFSLLSQALAFIEQQYTNDISLTDLARLLKVNPNYLSGVIHSGTGKTFRRFLIEKRIKEAEVFLKLHKKMNITEIAFLCGFNDSNYFSTVFKKIKGISPKKFRQKLV